MTLACWDSFFFYTSLYLVTHWLRWSTLSTPGWQSTLDFSSRAFSESKGHSAIVPWSHSLTLWHHTLLSLSHKSGSESLPCRMLPLYSSNLSLSLLKNIWSKKERFKWRRTAEFYKAFPTFPVIQLWKCIQSLLLLEWRPWNSFQVSTVAFVEPCFKVWNQIALITLLHTCLTFTATLCSRVWTCGLNRWLIKGQHANACTDAQLRLFARGKDDWLVSSA